MAKIEILKKQPLRFEKVNDVTWKLTDGEMTNVPASLGQWRGYRVTKATAWMMGVGGGAWVGRCGELASEPLPLGQAKKATHRMLSGLCDYRVTDLGAPDINSLAIICNRLDVWDPSEASAEVQRDTGF
jgi:hypothetical protein